MSCFHNSSGNSDNLRYGHLVLRSPVADLRPPQTGHGLFQILPQVGDVLDRAHPPRLWIFSWGDRTTRGEERGRERKDGDIKERKGERKEKDGELLDKHTGAQEHAK